MENLKNKSKYLSLLLRHKPENANITLDKNGWADIEQLIKNAKFTQYELNTIVATDNKGRYEFNENKTKIRAVQGHTIKDIDVELEQAIPPGELFHGTKEDVIEIILKNGLSKMNRNYVHLSSDKETARVVADRRKGKSVLLSIDAAFMRALNVKFYRSKNGVWLVDKVDPKFITIVK